jgi:hypothetical protein
VLPLVSVAMLALPKWSLCSQLSVNPLRIVMCCPPKLNVSHGKRERDNGLRLLSLSQLAMLKNS